MAKPLVVSIPHNLGKQEAARRLDDGVRHLKSQFGDKIASIDSNWTGDRMDFQVGTLGQTVAGYLEVMEESDRVEVMLHWILATLAEKVKGLIRRQGTLMLEKK